jgi:hypothetical protein
LSSFILFASWLLVGGSAGAEGPDGDLSALIPPQVSDNVQYKVIQLYSPESPQRGQEPFTLMRDRDVIMVVKNPERWFGQLFTRSGKLDPRAKVSTDTPGFADIQKQRKEAEKAPEGSDEKKRAIAQEQFMRDFVWTQQVKRWLEQSCFLVVEGKRFTDLRPIVVGAFPTPQWSSDTEYDNVWYLRFHPEITEKNKSDWMDLLSGQGFKPRLVTVTLGQSNVVDQNIDEMPTSLAPSETKENWVQLQIASPLQMSSGIIVVGLMLAAFLLLATKTTILQDFGADDELWHVSLGRSQMAFWFLVILISYVFLWIVTGDYSTLTQSELVLFGISATTGLGALAMSGSPKADAPRASEVLSAEEITITNSSSFGQLITVSEQHVAAQRTKVEAETDAAKKAELHQELQRLERRLAELKKRQAYFRRSRLNRMALDLVQETDSPSLHRFQMIAWTVVLGLVFINSVYFKLTMPKFDATLLALMGISNGTYLGFKFQASAAKTTTN